jgi:6-phospho-3-hexuloisomerase
MDKMSRRSLKPKEEFRSLCGMIIDEIHSTVEHVSDTEIEAFIALLLRSRRIFCLGTGRSGTILQSFCIRLNQLGMQVHWVGSLNCPPAASEDALIVCSGSGRTTSVVSIMQSAKALGVHVGLLTTAESSDASRIADTVIHIQAPSELMNASHISIQPMRTLFEQTAFIVCETIVAMLQARLHIKEEEMAKRHANLE